MVYKDYQEAQAIYETALKRYSGLLKKQQRLFAKTQLKGVRYDGVRVQSSKASYNDTLAALADIDLDIKRQQEAVLSCKMLLDGRLQQLTASRETDDMIYKLHFIDGMGVRRIASRVGYSRSQVYRIIRKMRQNATKAVL